MYFVFLWEVVMRAFRPTARVTDVLQILAASTIPAIGKFAGIELPTSAGNDALAYIGLIAVSFIVIRLLWAPYSLWKEQTGEIGTLKLELSKPERLVLDHLAKHRAQARVELIRRLVEMGAFACERDERAREIKLARAIFEVTRLAIVAGYDERFRTVLRDYEELCLKGSEQEMMSIIRAERSILSFIEGKITIEAVEHLLLSSIEPETQP